MSWILFLCFSASMSHTSGLLHLDCPSPGHSAPLHTWLFNNILLANFLQDLSSPVLLLYCNLFPWEQESCSPLSLSIEPEALVAFVSIFSGCLCSKQPWMTNMVSPFTVGVSRLLLIINIWVLWVQGYSPIIQSTAYTGVTWPSSGTQ